ncbi:MULTISPECIES: SDR family oxidoreductase [Mesorhizobium]|uniref:SDR family oxidoreductase n=1 Tax=Mesorhizobium australicum TaxID=536018 RepID=UPI00333BC80B
MSQAIGKISTPRTVVVVGATNEVGKAVAQVLTGRGHIVRGVARSLGVALDDSDALATAFSGADSAYVMIPFDITAPDLHRFEDEVGARLAAAIAKSGVRRVVLLSGLNAHLRMGTSLGAALMENGWRRSASTNWCFCAPHSSWRTSPRAWALSSRPLPASS